MDIEFSNRCAQPPAASPVPSAATVAAAVAAVAAPAGKTTPAPTPLPRGAGTLDAAGAECCVVLRDGDSSLGG
jgi:hypothetical protein